MYANFPNFDALPPSFQHEALKLVNGDYKSKISKISKRSKFVLTNPVYILTIDAFVFYIFLPKLKNWEYLFSVMLSGIDCF
jgi:hypothetical protein